MSVSLPVLYKQAIESHNHHVLNDSFPNSGFDLYIPSTQIVPYTSNMTGTLVDLQIKGEMKDNNKSYAYYLYPRSSMTKTPLMLSHSAGIIDSGYRGFIKASLRNLSQTDYEIEKGTRLVQIVHPTMQAFTVQLVNDESELSITTRGAGGFGSTGK
jgi:dUTP pyrophosphatase